MAESDSNAEKAGTRLKQAIEDIAENVSVAGLKEAITEHVTWIRHIFQIAVAICLVCVVYYIYGVAVEYLHGGYTNEIKIVDGQESMPLSNVTVCADVTVSRAFIKTNVTVPAPLAVKVAKATGYTTTAFVDEFINWISMTVIHRNVPTHLVKYFRLLCDASPQTSHYTAFLRSAVIQCRDMLKTCKFAGEVFDCCQNAKAILEDNGVCYQIAVSHDINSLKMSPTTKRQSDLGKSGGLTIEASLDLNDAPWFADTASGGFKIYVHPSADTPLLSPLTAPTEAETFVKVTAHERILNRICLPDNYSPPVYEGGYYDPFGYTCLSDQIQDAERTLAYCILPYLHYSPNASAECHAELTYTQLNLMSVDVDELLSSVGVGKNGQKMIEKIYKDLRRISKFRDKCPPRCRYWEYSSTASFVDLAKEKEFPKNLLYSRIHIYYTDFLYQQQEEVLAINIYLAFCNFGNVVGLYLGLSIVGIFEVIFWLAKYFSAVVGVCRAKRVKYPQRVAALVRARRVRRVQVTPL